jgi:hypothetical protein
MSRRIDVEDLDRHGAPDHRTLETDAVRSAADRCDALVRSIGLVDPVSLELARLRNAFHQQCRL